MSKVVMISRYLLGFILVVFGLNGFFNFIPMPPPTGASGDFMMALLNTGYIFPIVKGVEVLVGIAFLTNRIPALATVIFMPISVNIFLFHAVLDPATGMAAYLVFLLSIILLIGYKDNYLQMLKS